jgi:hypothetical protein
MLDRIHQCLVQAVNVQYQYSNEWSISYITMMLVSSDYLHLADCQFERFYNRLLKRRITLAFVLTIARMTSSRYDGSKNWSCGKLTPPKEWLSAVILRSASATLANAAADASDDMTFEKYMVVTRNEKTSAIFHECSRSSCCYSCWMFLLATYKRCLTATCSWQSSGDPGPIATDHRLRLFT